MYSCFSFYDEYYKIGEVLLTDDLDYFSFLLLAVSLDNLDESKEEIDYSFKINFCLITFFNFYWSIILLI